MHRAFPRLAHLLPLLGAAAALHLGCGGKVVVDAGSGAGGAGGDPGTTTTTTTTTSTSVTATTGTGVDCGTLLQAYEKTLIAATQCNACLDFDGCMQGPVFNDSCGCPIVLNSGAPDLVAAAKEANAAWLGAGCQPLGCGKPCFAGTNWSCHLGASGGCDGTCQPN